MKKKMAYDHPDVDPTSTFYWKSNHSENRTNRTKFEIFSAPRFFFNQSGPSTLSESVELDVEPPYVRLGY